jgi:hypothetical protein
MSFLLMAIGIGTYLGAAVAVVVLFGILLVPYLIKEIRQGKGELGPVRHLGPKGVVLGPPAPPGAGDNNPGRLGDPAPGMRDGQSDPYGRRARREAPPIKS